MKKFKNFLNQINFIYMITIYIFLLLCLVFFKTKSYEFNISSLIGIWKGFAELNLTLIEKGFIVYNDGGYDGHADQSAAVATGAARPGVCGWAL